MKMHDPPHPGEFIRETYIEPFSVSIRSIASSLNVSTSTLTRLINGQSGVSPEMALRLSVGIGRSAESWLLMQRNFDLWKARRETDLSGIKRVEFV